MPEVVIVGGGLEGCAAAWSLARRGVRDVTVVERSTVGSGGTGKSSGVVRCHYGVSSLAAMATRSLEVFEHAADVLGEDVGFHQTGYVVGVSEHNADALRASLSDQRAVGVRTEDIDRTEVQALWPVADLSPFAAFAWEERGGYGDAYQTAQAFSAAARRLGVQLRQGTVATELLVDEARTTGVRLADGSTLVADHVVVAAGPWSVPLLSPFGIDLPITVHREQIVLIDPGRELGPNKRQEAHLVTLTEHSEEFPLFQHPGTELLYMLEGVMVYAHGESSYTMRPGDALQLDGEGLHGPRELVELPIRFLSVLAHGEGSYGVDDD